MKPLISIVIPIYQVEQYIENCIKSICNQTFKYFEVVLVNDGTEDNSIEIAERILKDSKIKYLIINQDNKGLATARNIGIKNSNGRWVICVDSDDIVYEGFLKVLYEACIKHEVDISIGNYQIVNYKKLFEKPDKIHDSVIIEKKEMLQKFLTRKIRIIVPAILMKKEFIIKNNLFYDENIKFSEDQQFIWRILFSTDKYAYNKTPIYNYFLRPNSIMTSSSIEKIMTGYDSFVNFTNELKNKKDITIGDMIMARWVLGGLHSSAKILDIDEYKILLKKINYKEYIKDMMKFPDCKIKILALIIKISAISFYRISKRF